MGARGYGHGHVQGHVAGGTHTFTCTGTGRPLAPRGAACPMSGCFSDDLLIQCATCRDSLVHAYTAGVCGTGGCLFP